MSSPFRSPRFARWRGRSFVVLGLLLMGASVIIPVLVRPAGCAPDASCPLGWYGAVPFGCWVAGVCLVLIGSMVWSRRGEPASWKQLRRPGAEAENP